VCWQSLIRDNPLRGEAGSRLSEMIHFGKADVTCKHGSKTRPSRRRVGRVVSVSARSETSPSHESIDSTQRRPTRPRIGV